MNTRDDWRRCREHGHLGVLTVGADQHAFTTVEDLVVGCRASWISTN